MSQQCLTQLFKVLFPADFACSLCSDRKIWRFHQLQVLFVLRSSPRGRFVHPFRLVSSSCAAEFCERVKKMVVSGDSRKWNKTTHRKRIYQLIVKRLIFVCGRGGNDVFVPISA